MRRTTIGAHLWQPAVAARIDSYTPAGSAPGWERVADVVRSAVQAADPVTVKDARTLLSVLARLALFAHRQGHRAEVSLWLSPDFIECFVATGCPDVAASTRSRYRSVLWRLNDAIIGSRTGKPVKLSAATTRRPYSAAEQTALWAWACGQPTAALRTGCRQLLCLGLGCGLEPADIIALRGHDVHVVGNGDVVVTVTGHRGRRIICRRRWEGVLTQELASMSGRSHHVFRSTAGTRNGSLISGLLTRCHPAPDTPRLTTVRMRITWLAELIEAGLPLPVIVAAAGLENLDPLTGVLPFVSGVDSATASLLLRGRHGPAS